MAIKINKQLSTKDGFQVPSGTYTKFITEFKITGDKAEIALKPFVDKDQFDEGKESYQCDELSFGNIMIDLTTLTPEQAEKFQEVSAIIHEKVIEAISEKTDITPEEMEIVP
jgi:hypothetical protein